jgi:glycerol-3-phosphate dehydrogenase subunit B
MTYDVIIIGGGIAGLTCGIACAREGLHCAVISAGMSALHFSSGSLDLLSYRDDGRLVREPYRALEAFVADHPAHPYARCGTAAIRQAMGFFREQVGRSGLALFANGDQNHFHVTALGTLRPTYLSPASVFSSAIERAFTRRRRIAVLSIDGFRDFHPHLAAVNLRDHRLFKDVEIVSGLISLDELARGDDNPYEYRSVDIARQFDSGGLMEAAARRISRLAGDAGFVGLPAVLGLQRHADVYTRMQELTHAIIYEIPTLPPSILGMRLDNALKNRFFELGGEYIAGDRVVSATLAAGRVQSVRTRLHGERPLKAHWFVLATGSFFSGGMTSRFDRMAEPVFDLRLDYPRDRRRWYAPAFFAADSQPFLSCGVTTAGDLTPLDRNGQPVENLFCCGSVLSGYDPVKEGSGSGVAVSTAFVAARHILQRR